MPRTPKKPVEKLAPVADAILDQFGPASGMSMAEIEAATRRLKRALVERMLGGELSHHLGYAPGGTKPDDTANHRNGTSREDGADRRRPGRARRAARPRRDVRAGADSEACAPLARLR